jgi:sphingoid base N-palmitoyltransferase
MTTAYTGLFWTEQIWLPPNVSWSDLTNYDGKEEVNYRKFSDLWYPIPAAFLIILIRTFFER